MNLSDKITTLEDYLDSTWTGPNETRVRPIREWFKTATESFVIPMGFNGYSIVSSGGLPLIKAAELIDKSLWWMHREILRMYTGIYPAPTAALRQLNGLQPFNHFLAHVSKEDPNMVAFTASAEDGLRDRQTRIALGRFIRKNYHFITDKGIAAIEAAHRTELNPPVEFIVAMDKPDAFLEAYQSISSCMSKSTGAYGQKLMHPVSSYCTPGFQLAILRNASGGISARSLVWVNPENPEDKRYVRTYGDVVLHQYLIKMGYKPLSFDGSYIKTMIVKGGTDGYGKEQLVCPYVDVGSDVKTESEHNNFGVWDGADRIYLFKKGSKLTIPSEYRVSIQHSDGRTYGRPFPINRKCALTGEDINGLKDQFEPIWFNDKEDIALARAVKGWLKISPRHGHRPVYFPPDTMTFRHGASIFLDNKTNRHEMGYFRLPTQFYPDVTEWFTKNDKAVVYTVDGYIKNEDAIVYISGSPAPSSVFIHKSRLPKDAVRVAALNEVKTWAAADVPTVRTEANRKVVPGVHAVKQAYDGKWHYERQLHQVMLFGQLIWIPLDQTAASIDLTELPVPIKTNITLVAAGMTALGNAKKRALFETFAARGDMLCPLHDHGDKYEAGYIFEYRSMPLKLVETYLTADYDEKKVTKAPPAVMKMFHKFGRMVLDQVTKDWALAHPKASAKEAATVD